MKPKIRINTRDMEIVSRVFQYPRLTHGEIGKQFGISGARVSQIVKNTQRQVQEQIQPAHEPVVMLGGVAYFNPRAPLPDLEGPISFRLPSPRKDVP